MSFLSRLFGSGASKYESLDVTGISAEEKDKKFDEYAEKNGIPRYNPKNRSLKFGYSRSYAMSSTKCPQCDGKLEQHYAEVVYATDSRPKVSYTPAVFFCTECPTVVVDDSHIESSTTPDTEFRGVIAIEAKPKAKLFEAWDNEPVEYVFDDQKRIIRMKVKDPEAEEEPKRKVISENAQKKKKKKKRASKKSRRINRKK